MHKGLMQQFDTVEEIINYFRENEISKFSKYIETYKLDEPKNNSSFQFNSISLFNYAFNTYLIDVLKAERDKKKGFILNYNFYLNEGTVIGFLKYQDEQYIINAEKVHTERKEKDAFLMRVLGITHQTTETPITKKKEIQELKLPPSQLEPVAAIPTPTEKQENEILAKPVFKTEIIDQVHDILKDYFSKEQQAQLKLILETGNNISSKLCFKGNANQLSDTWQKLYDCKFIIGCQKEILQHWTVNNFSYSSKKNKAIDFKYETVRKGISTYTNLCKSPLIKVEQGQIVAIKQEQKKTYKKY